MTEPISNGPTTRRGTLPDPLTTAVVCIECQNGIVGPASILPALAAESRTTMRAVADLTTLARSAGALVVHAPFLGRLGADPGTTPLMRMTAKATAEWTAADHETKIIDGLLQPDDLIVGRHHGFSATMGTELLPILRGRGITSIVFAGVSLNVAIPVSVAHAAEDGFHVAVVREAVVGTPSDYGDQILKHTIAMLASVISLDDLTESWSGGGSDRHW